QEHLRDLRRAHTVADGGADMHGELTLTPQRGEQRQREHAARAPVEPWASPYLAPCGLGQVLLPRSGDGGGLRERAVDVGVAEDGTAHRHARFEWFTHRGSSGSR